MNVENKMKYSEAVRKLFEIMDGREDILEVRFDRKNDLFAVVSDEGIHVCFGYEFRQINESNI